MDKEELALYSSPLVVSFGEEIDEAIRGCFFLIDKPSDNYRLVKLSELLAELGWVLHSSSHMEL